jgi:transposase
LRAVFAGDLEAPDVLELLERCCSRAHRSRIPEFVKAARTIRKHRDGITAAVDRGMSNGGHEGLNNKIRSMINRAYGSHSAKAALALIMLACGPVILELPQHNGHPHQVSRAIYFAW